MAKPCGCGTCRLCWLYAHDDRYRRLWDDKPLPQKPVPLSCVHEGLPARPPEGKPVNKSYLGCEAGRGDPPGVVCRCECNSACPGYEADGQ